MLVPLRHATRSLNIGGDTVHLFSFPAEALRGIILGAQASLSIEASLKDLIQHRPELQHVHLSRAMLDFDKRSVKVRWPNVNE